MPGAGAAETAPAFGPAMACGYSPPPSSPPSTSGALTEIDLLLPTAVATELTWDNDFTGAARRITRLDELTVALLQDLSSAG